jgi:flagellar biosynthesis protein FlhB
VITNPTHFAVALAYKEGGAGAPHVVAKGLENIAEKIRAVAGEHRVPILESPALARALYRHAEIGDQIPHTLYEAVAQVLAHVYRLRAAAAGAMAAPDGFAAVEIPEGLDPQGAVR